MSRLIPSIIIELVFLLIVQYNHAQLRADPTRSQVKFFFPGDKLPANYVFKFPVNFKEVVIKTGDSIQLSCVLFRADSSKGIILYLHGNTGAIDKWGNISKVYTSLHYDLFMLDYRGYGKSEGTIKNEDQLFSDVQQVYYYLKSIYNEDKIIVLGYSIGTGPAAFLAANNHPRKLILQAPYYSLPDAVKNLRSSYDTSKIAFHFNVWQYIKKTSAPIVIFHGDHDKMFYYGSSLKLAKFFKPGDELITLKGAGHPFMDQNPIYLDSLKSVLR